MIVRRPTPLTVPASCFHTRVVPICGQQEVVRWRRVLGTQFSRVEPRTVPTRSWFVSFSFCWLFFLGSVVSFLPSCFPFCRSWTASCVKICRCYASAMPWVSSEITRALLFVMPLPIVIAYCMVIIIMARFTPLFSASQRRTLESVNIGTMECSNS